MKRPLLWRQNDFSAGMVSRAAPGPVQDNECDLLVNLILDEAGFARKRPGIRKLNATPLAGTVQGIFEHRPSDGTQHLLVMAGGTLYRWNPATSTFVVLASGFAAGSGNVADFVAYNDDLVVILDGVNAPQKYVPSLGTVSLLGGNPPAGASFGAAYFNHLFLSGVGSLPTRVWYSETADPEAGYDATNFFFDAEVGDASAVTGFLVRDQELIVGKRESITVVRGSDPRDFRQPQNRAGYSNEVGLVHHRAILDVGGLPWVLSDNGVYSLHAPFNTPEESWAIHDEILACDPARLNRAFAVRLKRFEQAIFWVPQPGGTHMNVGLVAHPGRGRGGLAAWSLWMGPELTAAAVGQSDTEGETLYLGDAAGFVYVQDLTTFTDDGAPIRSVFLSADIDFGAPDHLHSLREVAVEAEVGASTSLVVEANTDRGRHRDSRILIVPGPTFDPVEGADAEDPYSGRQTRRASFHVSQRGLRHKVKVEHDSAAELRLSAVEAKAYSYGRGRGRNA